MENTNAEILAELKLLRADIFAVRALIDYFEQLRLNAEAQEERDQTAHKKRMECLQKEMRGPR